MTKYFRVITITNRGGRYLKHQFFTGFCRLTNHDDQGPNCGCPELAPGEGPVRVACSFSDPSHDLEHNVHVMHCDMSVKPGRLWGSTLAELSSDHSPSNQQWYFSCPRTKENFQARFLDGTTTMTSLALMAITLFFVCFYRFCHTPQGDKG